MGKILALLMVGMLSAPTVTHATIYDFTASGFASLNDGDPGPYDPVSGWFEIKFGVLFGAEVTIGPRTYVLSDVGMFTGDEPSYSLYATANGRPVAAGTNDFLLIFGSDFGLFGPFNFGSFAYSVDGTFDIWRTTTGNIVGRVNVPEPNSLFLLGLGLAGLGLSRRRKAD